MLRKLLIVILPAILLSGCSMKNLNPGLASAAMQGMQALTLTNDDIIGYVKQSVAAMDAQNRVAPATSPYTKRLNKLVGGLTSVGDIPLNFKVYQTSEVNAFACADGSVRVYTGIMDLMDDNELLGIIGHEVGHVAMEHSKNAFKQQLINSALLEAAGSAGGTVAQLTTSQLGQLASAFASAKYSRKQENEADEFGYEFLKAAKRNPYSMVLAFEKMQALEQQGLGGTTYLQKMFSSHPETAERISHIKKLCERDGYKKPTK